MKALKGLLIGLVVILILVISIGGIFVGFNYQGHQSMSSLVNKEGQENISKKATSPENKNKTELPNVENSDITGDPAKDKVIEGEKQHTQAINNTKGSKDPEEYLQKLENARKLINEGNNLIAANSSSSLKANEGIYKLAQGLTLMETTMASMRKEFKQFRDDQ